MQVDRVELRAHVEAIRKALVGAVREPARLRAVLVGARSAQAQQLLGLDLRTRDIGHRRRITLGARVQAAEVGEVRIAPAHELFDRLRIARGGRFHCASRAWARGGSSLLPRLREQRPEQRPRRQRLARLLAFGRVVGVPPQPASRGVPTAASDEVEGALRDAQQARLVQRAVGIDERDPPPRIVVEPRVRAPAVARVGREGVHRRVPVGLGAVVDGARRVRAHAPGPRTMRGPGRTGAMRRSRGSCARGVARRMRSLGEHVQRPAVCSAGVGARDRRQRFEQRHRSPDRGQRVLDARAQALVVPAQRHVAMPVPDPLPRVLERGSRLCRALFCQRQEARLLRRQRRRATRRHERRCERAQTDQREANRCVCACVHVTTNPPLSRSVR